MMENIPEYRELKARIIKSSRDVDAKTTVKLNQSPCPFCETIAE